MVVVCIDGKRLREDRCVYAQENIGSVIGITSIVNVNNKNIQKDLTMNFHNLRYNISPPLVDNNIGNSE